MDQLERDPPGHQPDLLLIIGEHDVVDAGPALDRPGLAAGGARAGQGLKLERDMLGDMAEPGALAKPPLEAAADPERAAVAADSGQQGEQGVGEAGDPVARPFLQPAEIELDPDHRRVAVIMRAAIDPDLGHLHPSGQLVGSGIALRGEEHAGLGAVFLGRRVGHGRRLVRRRHDPRLNPRKQARVPAANALTWDAEISSRRVLLPGDRPGPTARRLDSGLPGKLRERRLTASAEPVPDHPGQQIGPGQRLVQGIGPPARARRGHRPGPALRGASRPPSSAAPEGRAAAPARTACPRRAAGSSARSARSGIVGRHGDRSGAPGEPGDEREIARLDVLPLQSGSAHSPLTSRIRAELSRKAAASPRLRQPAGGQSEARPGKFAEQVRNGLERPVRIPGGMGVEHQGHAGGRRGVGDPCAGERGRTPEAGPSPTDRRRPRGRRGARPRRRWRRRCPPAARRRTGNSPGSRPARRG